MTGWLAASGVFFVLVVSLYAGLANPSPSGGEPPALQAPRAISTSSADESRPAGESTPPQGQATTQPDGQTPAQPQQGGITTPVAGAEIQSAPSDAGALNRLDCVKIRGTQYHSPEERTWFLSNCVSR